MYAVWVTSRSSRSKIAVTKSRASEKIGEREVRSIVWPISRLIASSRFPMTETRMESVRAAVAMSALLRLDEIVVVVVAARGEVRRQDDRGGGLLDDRRPVDGVAVDQRQPVVDRHARERAVE